MAGGSVFISYRRDDAAGEAGRLADHLTRRFGPHAVFIDIDTIAPGTDFVVELERALGSTAVVVVVIGRKWLTVTNPDGSRRIDSSADFVRREVATALQRGIRVIPLLVQGAAMPSAADLPKDMAPLATRQASAIQHEEFGDDAQRLADAIASLVEGAVPRQGKWRGRALIGAATVAVLLGTAGWQWFRTDREAATDPEVMRTQVREEDAAMQSIRELSHGEGQTFAEGLKAPLAVVERATLSATGPRQADLLAHQGWAMFLRGRDGDRRIDPEEMYRKAIAVDKANPFANAMLGHWMLWERRGASEVERARPFFRIAADAGRATDVVRNLQLAALKNHHTPAASLEAIRVLDEMRRRGEPLRAADVSGVWSTYYFALGDRGDVVTADLVTVLPPAEHLLTLQWAFDEFTKDDRSRRQQFRYYTARLQAATGRTAEAREALRALKAEFGPSSGGPLPDAVEKALKELGAR